MTGLQTEQVLADGVRAVIADVDIAEDGLSARVGTQEVTAEYHREMVRVLAEAIYNVHHAGHETSAVPSRLRDRAIEERLRAVTPQRTTRAQVRFLRSRDDEDGARHALVELRGVRVWLPAAELSLDGVDAGDVLTVPVPAVRPAVSPGYFLVEGSRGWTRIAGVTRLYLHLPTVDAAILAWGTVLEHLERVGAPYRAKVLTAAEFYPRRDSLVVYLDDTAAELAGELAERAAALGVLADDTSAFAHRLCPGAAIAAEPRDTDTAYRGLSFGQHRATLLATALLAARGNPSDTEKEVFSTFTQHGADPAAPARNLAV